jgi:heat shock protein HslJ
VRLIILILASNLMIQGCTTTADVEALRGREWRLASIEEFPSLPAGVARPTIRFGSEGRISGNTGCNSAGAAYSVEGDALTIQPMMMTRRACLNPQGNELERAYVSAMERTRRFRISNDELELLDGTDRVLARFVPATA